MTVTHADGFPVTPVEVDTLLIGMGERYDVIVAPSSGTWPLVALPEGKNASASAIVRTSDVLAGRHRPARPGPPSSTGGSCHIGTWSPRRRSPWPSETPTWSTTSN